MGKSRGKKDIISILMHDPGLSDAELAKAIKGHRASSINHDCRSLESQGIVWRHKREDGLIGNWLIHTDYTHEFLRQNRIESKANDISKKKIKKILSDYLISSGWDLQISWGIRHGVDIEAKLGNNRWIIQVKGIAGSFHPIIVNNFLIVLGEIFQRMDDPNSKYSIALPDKEQFHRLWERLPVLAKSRMGITALFVNPEGKVVEEF